MPRPIGLSLTQVSAARTVTGAPVAADSGTLTDANIPPAISDTTGGAINTLGFSSIFVNVELSGGTAPTVTLDFLFRDADAADGSRWKRESGAVKPQLDGTGFMEVKTYGRVVYPRIDAVTGNPTGVVILAMPGTKIPGRPAMA